MKLQSLLSVLLMSTATVLVAQPAWAQVTQITGVQLEVGEGSLEVILQTADGSSPQVLTSSYRNTFVVNTINTQLALPEDKSFRADNPAPGINAVTVTQLGANSVRVTVVGTAVKTAKVLQRDASDRLNEGLVLSLSTPKPDTVADEVETQKPDSQTESSQIEKPEVIQEDEAAKPDATTTKPVVPSAEAEGIDVLVTAQRESGYQVERATTGTRTDTLLRDIPQSIQVVPEQVIEDQQAIQLDDVLRNVSGVFQSNTFGGTRDLFVLRGFSTFGGNILRNGFRESTSTFKETANLERVEVLKGPASVLFGNLEPGGVINLITKKPLDQPYYSTELQVGSFATYRPQIDFSGPLTPDGTLLYRLNAVYESSEGFRDFDQDIERFFIAPVLTWNISDRTSLTFEFDYLNDQRPFDRGVANIGVEVADIPYDRIIGEPDDVSQIEEYGIGYLLEHQFNENWQLRNTFRFLSTDTFDYRAQNNSDTADEAGNIIRDFTSNDDLEQTYNLQTNLIGEFTTGSIEHTLLFGVDWFRLYTSGTNRRTPDGITPGLNIFNPIYDLIPRPEISELTVLQRDNTDRSDLIGIYLQDQIALANNLKLLLNGRFDFLDQQSEDNLEQTTTNQSDQAFSPRVGIVYQPIEPVSLYASYSRSFVPNTGNQTFDGSILEPERGTQYEVGVRGELLDGRLITNLAAYEITKTNVATSDPINEGFSIPTGEVRSRGIELDVIGEILPGWNIIASYAYTDARVTEDGGSEREGRRLADVPLHGASLWTTYEIQSGNLQGLGFGAGVFFVGDREDDFEPFVQVPGYVRTDAAIFYRRDNWRAAVNIKNLFDVDYIQSGFYNPGAPLTVLGSLAVEF